MTTHGGPRPPAAPKITAALIKRDAEVFAPPPDFEARDGDVLVVSYPEVTIPLRQYANAKIGGLIYTRKLLAGDSVNDQFEKIYSYLSRRAEADAREKIRIYTSELRGE